MDPMRCLQEWLVAEDAVRTAEIRAEIADRYNAWIRRGGFTAACYYLGKQYDVVELDGWLAVLAPTTGGNVRVVVGAYALAGGAS